MEKANSKKLRRVIFCYNKVSLCIAVALAQKDRVHVNTIVFYMSVRCDSLAFQDCNVELIQYTKWNFVRFLIATIFYRMDEVCVPHMILGRLINTYSKYARALSAIDDGMDTFREKPRNIIPEYFQSGANYYTFTYDFPLATWLNRFAVQKICDIKNLTISSRPQASLSNITEMVIQSPGIGEIHHQLSSDVSNILIVKHPSQYKNTMSFSGMVHVSGAVIALEKTIDNFSGSLFAGESMTMVYALLCGKRNFKMTVMLTRNAFDNLQCLQPLFDKLRIPVSLTVS